MEPQNHHSKLQSQPRAVPPSSSARSASAPETVPEVNAVSGRVRNPLRQPSVPRQKPPMSFGTAHDPIIISIGGSSSMTSRNQSQHRRDRRSLQQPPAPRHQPPPLPMPLGTASDPIVLGIDGPPSASRCVSSQQLKRKADEEDALKFRKLSSEMTSALTCSICMDIMHNPISCIPCNHKYCAGCYSEWSAKSNTCPECRQKVSSALRDHFVGTIIEAFFQTSPGSRRSASILAELDNKDRVAGKAV